MSGADSCPSVWPPTTQHLNPAVSLGGPASLPPRPARLPPGLPQPLGCPCPDSEARAAGLAAPWGTRTSSVQGGGLGDRFPWQVCRSEAGREPQDGRGQALSLPTRRHRALPLLGEPQRHSGLSEPSWAVPCLQTPTEVSQEGDAGIATRALRPGWAAGSSSPGAPTLGVLVGATVGSPDCSPLALTAGASPPPHLPQQRQHPLPGPQGGLAQPRAGAWTDAGSGDGPTARPGSQPAGASQLSCVTWGAGWLGGSGTSDAGIPRSPQARQACPADTGLLRGALAATYGLCYTFLCFCQPFTSVPTVLTLRLCKCRPDAPRPRKPFWNGCATLGPWDSKKSFMTAPRSPGHSSPGVSETHQLGRWQQGNDRGPGLRSLLCCFRHGGRGLLTCGMGMT